MFEKINERIKKLTVVDMALVKSSVFFAAVIIVKFFPELLNVNYTVLFILMFACSAKPLYEIWIRR